MRFAGQRFREPSGGVGQYRTATGSNQKFRYTGTPPGVEKAKLQQEPAEVQRMTKTQEQAFTNQNFSMGSMGMPAFQVPGRV